jgi:multidrug efflux pump subunit AcrA (membrane-fusion protein)
VSPSAASGPSAELKVDWPASQTPNFGAPVQAVVTLDQKQNVLVVPKSAVREAGGRASVEVIDGTLRHLVSVQTGASTADSVEIVTGLNEGQLVLTRGS